MKKILVTGSSGFIGFHLCKFLLKNNYRVFGIDNMNSYYDLSLKDSRLQLLKKNKEFRFSEIDLLEHKKLSKLFEEYKFDYVIHLAAQAGVRFSIDHPMEYINSNVVGFANLLELCKSHNVKHLIFASSSSVYGLNKTIPFEEDDFTDRPISTYAASKKSNELFAFSYSHLFNIPITGLRFFTVYGPYGRPDMAYFSFTKSILENKPIKIFNNGNLKRDFTYIDDVIIAIEKVIEILPKPNSNKFSNASAPFRILNVGNEKPEPLEKFVSLIEKELDIKAIKINTPMQQGDVLITASNSENLFNITNFRPRVKIEEGLKNFVRWYKDYYK